MHALVLNEKQFDEEDLLVVERSRFASVTVERVSSLVEFLANFLAVITLAWRDVPHHHDIVGSWILLNILNILVGSQINDIARAFAFQLVHGI